MSPLNPEFVERYQIEYEKNPRSKVFAPLADAYRRMGLLDEAYRICKLGVSMHPDFAGGQVAFARVLLEKEAFEDALAHLERAAQISPDNILAHSLLAETFLKLRRPKDALGAYKMVLFHQPTDARALEAVRKWEFLTADDYDDDLFQMRPAFALEKDIKKVAAQKPTTTAAHRPVAGAAPTPAASPDDPWDLEAQQKRRELREVERAVSLADAFTVRNEIDKALDVLTAAKREVGSYPELNNRLALLTRRRLAAETVEENPGQENAPRESPTDDSSVTGPTGLQLTRLTASTTSPAVAKQVLLENFLRRINDRRDNQ